MKAYIYLYSPLKHSGHSVGWGFISLTAKIIHIKCSIKSERIIFTEIIKTFPVAEISSWIILSLSILTVFSSVSILLRRRLTRLPTDDDWRLFAVKHSNFTYNSLCQPPLSARTQLKRFRFHSINKSVSTVPVWWRSHRVAEKDRIE